MFLWIKCLEVSDTRPMIMDRALKKDVILLPGREFMTDPSQPCPYMRASFSLASPENIDRVRGYFKKHRRYKITEQQFKFESKEQTNNSLFLLLGIPQLGAAHT